MNIDEIMPNRAAEMVARITKFEAERGENYLVTHDDVTAWLNLCVN